MPNSQFDTRYASDRVASRKGLVQVTARGNFTRRGVETRRGGRARIGRARTNWREEQSSMYKLNLVQMGVVRRARCESRRGLVVSISTERESDKDAPEKPTVVCGLSGRQQCRHEKPIVLTVGVRSSPFCPSDLPQLSGSLPEKKRPPSRVGDERRVRGLRYRTVAVDLGGFSYRPNKNRVCYEG